MTAPAARRGHFAENAGRPGGLPRCPGKAELRAPPRPPATAALIDRLLDRLRFADSYSRAQALIDLADARHPRWPEMLGEHWTLCDFYPPAIRRVLRLLQRDPGLRGRAMSDEERRLREALPAAVTVWRGCYASNRRGLSWSLSRAVAASFPLLSRYRRVDDGPPLLLQAVVNRADILFVKLEREEQEVVALPSRVRVASAVPLEVGH